MNSIIARYKNAACLAKPCLSLKYQSVLIAGILLLSGLGSPAVTSAAENSEARHYTVEIVAFSYEEQSKNLSEKWLTDSMVELPDTYLELYRLSDITPSLLSKTKVSTQTKVITKENGEAEVIESPVGPVPLNTQQRSDINKKQHPDLFFLPKGELQLHSQRKRLERREKFRVLFHGGWHMPIYNRKSSTPIRIKGGDIFDKQFELDGSITISVARYLHVDTNLYLRNFEALQPTGSPSAQSETRAIQTAHMQQSRRMRSRELHYIDHPGFGLLILFTPR